MKATCFFFSLVDPFLLYASIPAFPPPSVRSSWEALTTTLTLDTRSFFESVDLALPPACRHQSFLNLISLDPHHKCNPHTANMSSDLPRTPSTIMDFHVTRGIDAMLRAAPGSSFTRPRNGSPRSTMANNEEGDPSEEQQQKMTQTLLAGSAPATAFSSADKELLESGKFADAKIIANGKTYNVHKNVLCTRNKWFRRVLEGAFRVSALL